MAGGRVKAAELNDTFRGKSAREIGDVRIAIETSVALTRQGHAFQLRSAGRAILERRTGLPRRTPLVPL